MIRLLWTTPIYNGIDFKAPVRRALSEIAGNGTCASSLLRLSARESQALVDQTADAVSEPLRLVRSEFHCIGGGDHLRPPHVGREVGSYIMFGGRTERRPS